MFRCTARLLLACLCFVALATACAHAQTTGDDVKKKAKQAIGKQQYDQALDLLTDVLKATRDDAEAFYLRGLCYFQTGNLDKAVADIDDAIGLEPGYFGFYRLRGRVYAAKRDYDKALDNFDYAIELAPKEPSSYLDRGFVHSFRKEYDKALADYNDYIRLDPKSPAGYYWRGSLRSIKGEYTQAVADLTKALAIDPKLAEAHLSRGGTYMKTKEYAKAIDDFRAAIALAPTDELGYNNLAWLLATSPDTGMRHGKQAVEYATKACSLSNYRRAHTVDTLAAAYAEAGDFKAAVRWQERAIRMLPAEQKADIADYRERLTLYQQGKPYRLK